MTPTEAAATIESGLDRLPEGDRNFAQSLASQVRAGRRLSEKQAHWIEEMAKRTRRDPLTREKVGDLRPLLDLFEVAAQHRKAPSVVIAPEEMGRTIKLYRTTSASRFPGEIGIKARRGRTYFGRIDREGVFHHSPMSRGKDIEPLLAFLRRFAADPAGVAAAAGRISGECCFCARDLTDERSLHVGYGPTCASKFGLPWGERPGELPLG